MNKNCVLLFVKYPEPGMVKTRLAEHIGPVAAGELYKCFVNDVLKTLNDLESDIWICYTPEEKLPEFKQWLGSSYEYVLQTGEDLGGKMKNCFVESFRTGYEKVLVLGSDSPDISADILKKAYRYLDRFQAVAGPSGDGGYYILGFNNGDYLPEIFDGIKWSTNSVFNKTVDILNANKYNFKTLPECQDVDTLEDLRQLYKRNLNKNSNLCSIKYIDDNMADLVLGLKIT